MERGAASDRLGVERLSDGADRLLSVSSQAPCAASERLEEVAQLCRELAPGSTITAVERSRFGNTNTRRNTQDQLYIRNLLNILRANSAQAAWEMEKGVIGKWLRDFEARNAARRKRRMPGQMELFEDLSTEDAPTPKCDSLTTLLSSKPLRDIDRKRYRACAEIQERKARVVFLAERTDTLEIFAEELSRIGLHTNYVVGNRPKADTSALRDLYGIEAGSFERIVNGKSVESYFRPGGRKAPKGPASVFMTYKMAEGINLQSGELALLSGREAFTMLHLKGTDARDSFLPPRLLMIRQNGSEGAEIIRDQIACAQLLDEAYERTKSLGFEDESPSRESITAALAALASHVDELTEWDLRPSRLESLLKALAAFVRRYDIESSAGDDVALSDQEMFGHLSLQALEMIAESWGRLIDPFWEQVKHEVRTSFAYDGIPQGYIALEQVLQKLESDYLNREVIHDKMLAVLDEAERLSARHEPEIANRIAVAFFSEGVGEH